MKRYSTLFLTFALAILCIISFVFLHLRQPKSRRGAVTPPITNVAFPSQELVDWSFRTSQPYTSPTDTRIVIIPHHLIASRQIASTLSGLPMPSEILLVSPNHFLAGHTALVTTSAPWKTYLGETSPSPELDSLLRSMPSVSDQTEKLAKEHGVYGLLPFIQHAFPNVPVSVAAMRFDASSECTESFADSVAKYLRSHPHALFISTVDFSHYQNTQIADLHDMVSEDVMLSLDASRARKAEVDDPALLDATLRTAKLLGLGHVAILDHTNSLRIAQAFTDANGTSHFFVAFSPGVEAQPKQFLSAWLTPLETTGREQYSTLLGDERRTLDGFDELVVTPTQRTLLKQYPGLNDDLTDAANAKVRIDANTLARASGHSFVVSYQCGEKRCTKNIGVTKDSESRLHLK